VERAAHRRRPPQERDRRLLAPLPRTRGPRCLGHAGENVFKTKPAAPWDLRWDETLHTLRHL